MEGAKGGIYSIQNILITENNENPRVFYPSFPRFVGFAFWCTTRQKVGGLRCRRCVTSLGVGIYMCLEFRNQ